MVGCQNTYLLRHNCSFIFLKHCLMINFKMFKILAKNFKRRELPKLKMQDISPFDHTMSREGENISGFNIFSLKLADTRRGLH